MTTPKIAVLCDANLWHVGDLRRAAKLRSLDLKIADPEKLRAECPAQPGAPQSLCGRSPWLGVGAPPWRPIASPTC